MKNLLAETLAFMDRRGQSPATVAWVGSKKAAWSGSWEDFAALANFEYDDDFGGHEISLKLVVVFRDGSWLERHEYDGSEWWEYKATPTPGGDRLTSERQLKAC